MKFLKIFKKNWPEVIFFLAALTFSWWLMWHTFIYKNGSFLIALKAWSDFASHIPLIRSFSLGDNFPPEFPLFPGEKIRYHFLFYALVGLGEKLGIPVDWALNFPSAISFFLLLVSIYLLAKYLFKSRFVAILSVIFFLFNGSLSFLEFIKTHPLNFSIFSAILNVKEFPAFFPYNRSSLIAGGFWNLNVFTNQRHLSSALALLIFSFLFVLRSSKNNTLTLKSCFLIGILLGILPYWNGAVFIMAVVAFGTYFFLSIRLKPFKLLALLVTTILIAIPQILIIRGGNPQALISYHPGYLIHDQLNILTFIKFWVLNLGLGTFLIPLGFFLSGKEAKTVFLSFLSLFFIGNLFQFSPDLATNHKFFNLFIIISNIFIAYSLVYFFKKNLIGRLTLPSFILLLTISGIIDFFAIKNDPLFTIPDFPNSPDATWIKQNTPTNAVFLNSTYLYHPASLAGRKIFLGWPYFSWSAGYDTNKRETLRIKLLEASFGNKNTICTILKANNIQFVSIEKTNPPDFIPNFSFWENNFLKVYNNQKSGLTIYNVTRSCLL